MPTQHHQIGTPIQNVNTVISRVKTVLQMYGNHNLYIVMTLRKYQVTKVHSD